MADEPEVIRQQMEETRHNLAEKLEALESQVVGTVQDATSAVNETVETIKEAAQTTVGTVKDTVQETVATVKETFDLELQFQRHPWVMLGGSVAVGFAVGSLLERRRDPGVMPQRMSAASEPRGNGYHRAFEEPAPPPEKAEKSKLLSTVGEVLGPEVGKLKSLAIGVFMGLVRDTVTRSLSGEVGEQVRQVVDDMTERLGGHKLQEPLLKQEPGPRPTAARDFAGVR